jgi:hypothetical protein
MQKVETAQTVDHKSLEADAAVRMPEIAPYELTWVLIVYLLGCYIFPRVQSKRDGEQAQEAVEAGGMVSVLVVATPNIQLV